MSIIINKISQDYLSIKKTNRIGNIFGLVLTVIPIIVFVSFMVLQPSRMGKTIGLKIFSIVIIGFLIFYLSRIIYLAYVDKNIMLMKNGLKFLINSKEYFISDIVSILIIEYSGFRTISNGFNLFLKLQTRKKIPVVIRVNKEDMEKVSYTLQQFLNIEKVEKKFWWIN